MNSFLSVKIASFPFRRYHTYKIKPKTADILFINGRYIKISMPPNNARAFNIRFRLLWRHRAVMAISQSVRRVTDRVRPECTVVGTGPSGVQSVPSSRLDRPEKTAVDKIDRTQHGVRRRRDWTARRKLLSIRLIERNKASDDERRGCHGDALTHDVRQEFTRQKVMIVVKCWPLVHGQGKNSTVMALEGRSFHSVWNYTIKFNSHGLRG